MPVDGLLPGDNYHSIDKSKAITLLNAFKERI